MNNLLKSRYGQADKLPEIQINSIIDCMLLHRSVRSFLPTPVSASQLNTMITAAQSAASSSNLHLWSVVAVTQAATREKLSVLAGDQAHIRQAPLQLLWVADLSRLRAMCAEQNIPAAGLDYLEMYTVASIDTAIAAQNAVLAAESMGLGTVYVGGIRNHADQVAALIGLPPESYVVFGMSVGVPDPAHPSSIKPRPGPAYVLHHERYDATGSVNALKSYNEIMAQYYEAHGMDIKGSWAQHSAKRVSAPENLSGRALLKEKLQQLGFKLK